MNDFQFLLFKLVALWLFKILLVEDSKLFDIARNYLFAVFGKLLAIDNDLNQTDCEECNYEVGKVWVLVSEVHKCRE